MFNNDRSSNFSSVAFAANYDSADIVELTNQKRREYGLDELKTNQVLNLVARAKANDLLQRQYWSHYDPEGRNIRYFLEEFNYTFSVAGENLAKDFYSHIDVVNAWMNSPSHRQNILEPRYREIGVAVVEGNFLGKYTNLVVQVFASPTSESDLDLNNLIKIILPQDNHIQNTPFIYVQGYAENAKTVEVFKNNTKLGELPVVDKYFSETFDLEDGIHRIFAAKSQDSGQILSEPKQVIIDTTPPFIQSIYIYKLDDNHNLLFLNASEMLKELVFGSFTPQYDDVTQSYYFILKEDGLKNGIDIKLIDIAGNESNQTYQKDQIKNASVIPSSIYNKIKEQININQRFNIFSNEQKLNMFSIFIIGSVMTFDIIYIIRRMIERKSINEYFALILVIPLVLIGIFVI
ncbi:MAG: CAP domain-containing protein [Candidatus Dojkabacteria bacterium]|nr:CAP domain-containing protein [Candidatus Dojkabacteria bacterium]